MVGGDFFQFVPEGDAYLLKGVVHDWSDGDAGRILRCCRRSISADGRLLLVETVLRPHDKPASGMMDLLMLVVGGRTRANGTGLQSASRTGWFLDPPCDSGRPVVPSGMRPSIAGSIR